MRLDHVLREAPAAVGIGIEVEDLAYDHRLARPGTLFFCVSGFAHDGHAFAPAAVDAGAVALVAERPLNLGVPDIVVRDTRAAMALAAATFFGDPTASLLTVGVTGTNGKTTSAFLLRALLLAGGRQTGLLGTVKSVIGGVEHPTQRTTPEAIDLQRTFRAMRDEGDRACVMEVSSHALALRRADAIHFAAALFTNLTQDHLDFHPTMEDYFLAKRALFVDARPDVAVVNIDDSYGARLAAELPEAVTYSLRANAHFRATEVETDIHGSRFVVGTPAGALEVRSPLRGEFNVYNVLGALATAVSLEIPAEVCVEALRDAQQVPGRFETVDQGQPFAVIVDYAHTPDSLENVLHAARDLAAAQVRVVFGCGGDRDRGKRPLMGAIGRRLADEVIITSDNPRSENPDAIIAEILEGAGSDVAHEVDRRRAIERAIRAAQPGDVVVIAGKGHEQGQEFAGGQKVPFDDVGVAREVLTLTADNVDLPNPP